MPQLPVAESYVLLSTLPGYAQLAARSLRKDLAAARKELAGTTGKLSNEGFLAKAPTEVVDKIRARQQLAEEEVERITARLDALPTP